MKRAIYGPYTTVILSVTTVYVVVNGSARLVYGGRNDGPGNMYQHEAKVLTEELKVSTMSKDEFGRLMEPYLNKLQEAANKFNAFSHSLA
jgi:hypothetical protein